ncbi:MAG TPA: hypothetical protein P5544_10340 [Candidatus Nanopelagicales bacterium]|mgnify:CR=1 FL=1|nr:hypothetical protein [Candidatus Nanopelagicales bacterium]
MERSPEFKPGQPFEQRPQATPPDRSRIGASVGKVATASTVQQPTAQTATPDRSRTAAAVGQVATSATVQAPTSQQQVQDLYAEYGPALKADESRSQQVGPDMQWESERSASRDR